MTSNNLDTYIPSYTDISDWEIIPYSNTGGSRAKKVAIKPETEDIYFFKGSKVSKTGEIRYPTEFWSEIVSSKIGQYFGFHMLDYNIAYKSNWDQQIGCISKSMIEHNENKLTEGKAYLTGYEPKYNPKEDHKDYTFQFIHDALAFFTLNEHLPKIVEMIIFDGIIGNSDRHQENWGFINYFNEAIDSYNKEVLNKQHNLLGRWLMRFKISYLKHVPKHKVDQGNVVLQSVLAPSKFSPIYDSGCCLGREHLDHKVDNYIKDEKVLINYINKGKSEIHWEGKDGKQNHFELIKLLKDKYKTTITNTIKSIEDKYNEQDIHQIVNNIDSEIPDDLKQHKLTKQRKEMMIKLITLRTQKLFELK